MKGGILKKFLDVGIIVESPTTSKIQEVHRIIYHIMCEIIENELKKWKK